MQARQPYHGGRNRRPDHVSYTRSMASVSQQSTMSPHQAGDAKSSRITTCSTSSPARMASGAADLRATWRMMVEQQPRMVD
ncbi:hypothetical protein PR202_ga22180 [Eleusine coracana subsp. coracana]|uniref:Uncharacterized protein n=1 Tax=Eleusine coracana subsp. coracana TaxID=191504 RepID=A0AAV5D2F4_ELECO|nr:hypothetical protein PR202_ga22180 [Eleusine coracana subsp. coracana]